MDTIASSLLTVYRPRRMAVQRSQTTMAVWGDEGGNLDFDKTGTKYFIVCSIVTPVGGSLGQDLLALRHGLVVDGAELLPYGFHATEDIQQVRDQVFALLAGREIRADASLYRKDKVYDYIRQRADFQDYIYRLAWYLHFKHVLPEVVPRSTRPLIVNATLGTKSKQRLHAEALKRAVQQSVGAISIPQCAYWTAASHPLLQAADYYTWALGARHERQPAENRPWDVVKHQFKNVVAPFGW